MIHSVFLLAAFASLVCFSNAEVAPGSQPAGIPCNPIESPNETQLAHPTFKQEIGLCNVTYRVHPDGLELSVSAPTTGWLGIAFPTDMAGNMHDAWALVGTKIAFWTVVSEYRLMNQLPAYIPGATLRTPFSSDENSHPVLKASDTSFEIVANMATLDAFVPYNSRIVPDTTIPFVCAYSFSNSPAIAYHGGNRFVGAFNLYCPDEE